MTPCLSPRFEETLVIVDRKRSKSSIEWSQNNGSSTITQLQIMSPRRNTSKNTMVRVYPTLWMPLFQGGCSEDLEKHLFIFEMIW
jgi:hypothetical protein